MITGAIKNKVDKIWTDIWAGGITNPLTVIEQLTYLMFIRSLDEKELETEELENLMGEKMEHIFPASSAIPEAWESETWRPPCSEQRRYCSGHLFHLRQGFPPVPLSRQNPAVVPASCF